MKQSFLADAPVHAILRRNPDLATSLYAVMAGTEDEAVFDQIEEISRGKWEGLAIERSYPTLVSLRENWLVSIEPMATNGATHEIRLLAGAGDGAANQMGYPADPTWFDKVWDTFFTNGPSITAVFSKGLLHGLKMDYTIGVPGDVVKTNGKQAGDTIDWHYALDRMAVGKLKGGVADLLRIRPTATLRCKTWPKLESEPQGGKNGTSETLPWAPATVISLDKGKSGVPKLGAHISSTDVSRLYSGNGTLQRGSLNIKVHFSYGSTDMQSLSISTSDHDVSCAADPNLKISTRGLTFSNRSGDDRVTRGDFFKTFSMELSPDSPKSLPIEEWAFNVKVGTKRTNGVWTLTFPERGHHVVSWDGVTEPKISPDPDYAIKSVVTSLAFVRGADAETTRLMNQHRETGRWKHDRRTKHLTHPTGARQPATMKLRYKANEDHYRLTFSGLVLP